MVATERRDLRTDAALEALVAEVAAPRPDDDRDANRVVARIEPHFAVADERERPDVALVEVVAPQALERGRLELGLLEGNLHQVDVGRLVEPAHVLAETEHRRPARVAAVAADALEDAETVVERVGEDVDVGVGPGFELTVEPDRLAPDPLAGRHLSPPRGSGLSGAAGAGSGPSPCRDAC